MDLIRRRMVETAFTRLSGVIPINISKSCIAYLAVFSATVSLAASEGSAPSVSPSVKERIDALLQAQPARHITPGIAVAIAKNGQTIYENTAGERDLSSHAPMLITTPQPIGSITKQFTAAAILLLQQENKLSIDDKLSKFVPEYIHGDEITLRQMLNMVSGISDNDPAIYGDHLTQPITRKEMLANLNKLPLMWKPGTHMVYTNTNYNLLGLIVERGFRTVLPGVSSEPRFRATRYVIHVDDRSATC